MSSTIVNGVGSMMRSNGMRSKLGLSSMPLMLSPEATRAMSIASERRARRVVGLPTAAVVAGDESADLAVAGGEAALELAPPMVELAMARWASRMAATWSRVRIPIQVFPSTIGKSDQCWPVASKACSKHSVVASGGNTAVLGRSSSKSDAMQASKPRGTSLSKYGKFFLSICSSSWPRSLMARFTAKATDTLSMTTGVMLKSFTHSTTMSTTAAAICLKPQSIAEAPTTA
mmetsp:Transcript_5853/g.16985  ORF Transcript_5853/g.16985 Transcript_5853/m.16985 type:complete len:231 (-) Transcript_5853:1449-2141(-)